MNKYEIEFNWNFDEDGAICIPIKQSVERGDCISDSFGIDADTNSLFFFSHFSIEDLDYSSDNEDSIDFEDFLKNNFKDHHAVKGFIRRVLMNSDWY